MAGMVGSGGWRRAIGATGLLVGGAFALLVARTVSEDAWEEARFAEDLDVVRSLVAIEALDAGPGATAARVASRTTSDALATVGMAGVVRGRPWGGWRVEARAGGVVVAASVPDRLCHLLDAGRRDGGRCSAGRYEVEAWTASPARMTR